MKTIARWLGVWFGCGYVPVAPGTAGTLGALPLYWAVRGGGALAIVLTAIAITFVGVWAAGIVADAEKKHDPQIVVIDEVAGVLFALAAAPETLAGIAVAVVSFRIFDSTKPFPARRAEKLPRGWGIVLDDVVAGLQSALVLGVLRVTGVLG